MAQFAYSVPYGAQLINDKHVRFAFWAPDIELVTLEIAGRTPLLMERHEDGLHSCIVDAREGASYRYRITPDLAVPDPASRAQQDDVHGPSLLINPREFHWRHSNWQGRPWQEIVIYEIHCGCYGGFSALEKQLRYLADMGITAIELMPIADFSGARNWGYDGVLPYAPDSTYGTPDELKHLIDTAHGHGLCVYLDVVYNHFGPDGNYLHTYASSFFSEDNPSPWGPSIDFSQHHVREFFTHNALYWLMEYRFDGLRLDAVHAISDPDWLDELAARIRQMCEPDRHIHLMLENERNNSAHLERNFDAQWNDDIHNVLHVLLTGEQEGYYANYQKNPVKKLVTALTEGFVYQGEPAPARNNRPRGTPSAHLSPYQFVFFLQNHDQVGNRALGERLTQLTHQDALRAAITLQLLCPQIPLLFMGEERGLTTPFLFFTDFHGELADAVRDGRRQEFSAFSHFSDPQSQAKIPDPNNPGTFRRSAEYLHDVDRAEYQEWQTFYRKLLSLRHQYIVPHLRSSKSLGAMVCGEFCVSACWKLTESKTLRVIINLGEKTVPIDPIENEIFFESKKGAGEQVRQGQAIAYSTSVFIESLS